MYRLETLKQAPKDVGNDKMAAQTYFAVFGLLLKQQREEFAFTARSRRPLRNRINCLISFLYALVRHDCISVSQAGGRPEMDYVPEEQARQVADYLKNFQKVRRLLEKICNINRQLLRRRVKF